MLPFAKVYRFTRYEIANHNHKFIKILIRLSKIKWREYVISFEGDGLHQGDVDKRISLCALEVEVVRFFTT